MAKQYKVQLNKEKVRLYNLFKLPIQIYSSDGPLIKVLIVFLIQKLKDSDYQYRLDTYRICSGSYNFIYCKNKESANTSDFHNTKIVYGLNATYMDLFGTSELLDPTISMCHYYNSKQQMKLFSFLKMHFIVFQPNSFSGELKVGRLSEWLLN